MQTNEPGSLQNKFQDFGAVPSEQLWNSIATNLDEKKKRRGVFWWWFIGAASFVTVLFGVYQLGYNDGAKENNTVHIEIENQNSHFGYAQCKNNKIHNETLIENETTSDQNLENLVKKNNDNNLLPKNENESLKNNSINNSAKSSDLKNINTKNKEIESTIIAETVIIRPNSINREASTNENFLLTNDVNKIPNSSFPKIEQTYSHPQLMLEPLVQIEKPTPKNHLEIGFNIGTLKGLNTNDQNLVQDPSLSLFSADNLDATNSIEGTGLASFSNLSESQVNIRRPIQFEFTIERNIKKRGHFQTGLTLGMLFSNNFYSSGGVSSVRSKFLSIGIPLHFNFDLIQRNRFSIYTGIGVNYEVPVFESVKTSYSTSALESVSTKNFTKGYMISTQVNTGIRFQINQNLKLDFRPNLRYYIHQSLKSVYPALERKIWIGASLGLVWEI